MVAPPVSSGMTPLFDASPGPPPPPAEGPLCAICPRPARWNPVRREFGRYCHGSHCSNPERFCKQCRKPFDPGVGEAGTRYCSNACKAAGYKPLRNNANVQCAWCGNWAEVARRRTSVWPYICDACIYPIRHVARRLRLHHVPADLARKLTVDPGCPICGRDILEPVRISNVERRKALLTVDHDHRCCPGPVSCGRCVRGLICTYCNVAEGLLDGDPGRAEALAGYLRQWGARPA